MGRPDEVHVLRWDGERLPDVPSLMTLARPFLDQLASDGHLPEPPPDEAVRLLVLQSPAPQYDSARGGGLPLLLPRLGNLNVIVERDGKVVYRHPHPVAEVVGAALADWLDAQHAHEPMAGFAVCPPGIKLVLRGHRPRPDVEGEVDVGGEAEAPRFTIRPLPEPPLPERRLADFAVVPDVVDDPAEPADGAVTVLIDVVVLEALRTARYSDEMEEGGFLLGRAYVDPDDGRHLLHVTGAVDAQHTGASLLHFAFTGDSFSAVKRLIGRERPDERLVGWYHTHLFAATEAMGLSSIDLQLHFTTFRIPWQVAGLVNLAQTSDDRVVRFYVRDGNTMKRCPVHVLAPTGMGDAR